MSRNLTLMENRGLVRTSHRSAGGRSLTVTISDLGTETLARASAAWTEAQTAVTVIGLLGPEAPALLDAWLGDLEPLTRS